MSSENTGCIICFENITDDTWDIDNALTKKTCMTCKIITCVKCAVKLNFTCPICKKYNTDFSNSFSCYKNIKDNNFISQLAISLTKKELVVLCKSYQLCHKGVKTALAERIINFENNYFVNNT
jgi:hypothetical protein